MVIDREVYKWFIAHVTYRNEDNVKKLLEIADIEFYMPFQKATRLWNGMRKEFLTPVISSCVFVRICESDYPMLQMMREISLFRATDGTTLFLSENEMSELFQELDMSDDPCKVILRVIECLANNK